jgi:hypothetical protein
MTLTECLTQDSQSRNTHAVAFSPAYRLRVESNERRSGFSPETTLWQDHILWPVGMERGSSQITVVSLPSKLEEFIPRTLLGSKLLALRNRAIASGMRLLSEDEVLEEVRHRRGELENGEADVS